MIDDWTALAGDSPASRATRAELLARWSEPHRRYHTTAHLTAVLAAVDRLTAPEDGTVAEGTGADGTGEGAGADGVFDPVAVRLAVWFHDAVYEGRPGWDEERSAQLAQSRLPRCGVPAARVAEVARLVRLTAAHDRAEPGDRDAAVLCDADLAVLAGPGYDAYAAAVREEYAHVPDEAFRQGRAEVLRRLLNTPSLYRTRRGRELWEERARANLAAELAVLERR
ncbi:metal-dependent phosphohydrolase [Nonomuraea pusilla]|uniref:HD domain-containing protein n=1 Tax=Nonomuraea pusilla TaxID=46177 RepID=UPI00332E62DE